MIVFSYIFSLLISGYSLYSFTVYSLQVKRLMSGATTRYKDINNNNLSSFLGITTGFKKSFLGLQDMCLSFYHLFSYLLYIKRSNLRYHRFVSLAILTVWPLTPLRKLISAIPYSVNERSDDQTIVIKSSWMTCSLCSSSLISCLL